MKRLLFIVFVFATVQLFAQTPVTFSSTKHFFNNVKQNVPATCSFSFKNTGTKPLIIESALAGCGCTTPEYPKQPIAVGKTGSIKVTYNAATLGSFSKEVTVKFLNVEKPIILYILGQVIEQKKTDIKH